MRGSEALASAPLPPAPLAMIDRLQPGLLAGALSALLTAGVAVTSATREADDQPGALRRSRTAVRAAAAEIDTLVDAGLDRAGVAPNARADDSTFLRRASLAIAGRIPTAEEATTFLDARGRDLRAELIDALLESPAYVSASFHDWADLFRAKTRLNRRVSGEPFLLSIKESLYENKPYDEWVRELVTAEGPAHQRGNGATGLLLRDRGMPEDSMSNTLRIFLGTRMECAQCHNHPFKEWTQKEYFEMVAFTGGMDYRVLPNDLPGNGELASAVQDLRTTGERSLMRASAQYLQTVTNGISGSGTGMARLPHDYQYDDAAPEEWVAARTILGEPASFAVQEAPSFEEFIRNRGGDPERMRPRQREGLQRRYEREKQRYRPQPQDSREVFGDWLTSPDNPLFTRMIVNRVWKDVFGLGLIEPADDLDETSVASNPELLAYLERLMLDLDYDLKEFQRALYYTKAWQREAVSADLDPEADFHFQGPILRRMSAEETWDSLLTLVVPDVDGAGGPPVSERAEAVFAEFETITQSSREDVDAQLARAQMRFTDPDAFRAMRGEEQRARRAEGQQKRQEARPLYRDLAMARRRGDQAAEERALVELAEMGLDPPEVAERGRAFRGLERASELSSPAPDGHLVRQFGQSDREQVDGSHTDASVPQVLTMLNGFAEERILGQPQAVLTQALAAETSAAGKVRAAYLALLTREPTSAETRLWTADFRSDPEQAEKDLVWTLLNTHEFLFVR